MEENIVVTPDNQDEWKKRLENTKTVKWLYIHENAKITAPKLETVDGLSIYENATLTAPKLETVKWLYIHENATLTAPKLETVNEWLDIRTKLSKEMERRLWKHNKQRKWFLTDNCSEYLLSREGNIQYRINGVDLDKEMFDKVRNGRGSG